MAHVWLDHPPGVCRLDAGKLATGIVLVRPSVRHSTRRQMRTPTWPEAQTDLVRGSWRDPRDGRTLLGDYSDEWLSIDLAKAPTTKVRDVVVMRKHVFPTLGRVPLADITSRDVQLGDPDNVTDTESQDGQDQRRCAAGRAEHGGTRWAAVRLALSVSQDPAPPAEGAAKVDV